MILNMQYDSVAGELVEWSLPGVWHFLFQGDLLL